MLLSIWRPPFLILGGAPKLFPVLGLGFRVLGLHIGYMGTKMETTIWDLGV